MTPLVYLSALASQASDCGAIWEEWCPGRLDHHPEAEAGSNPNSPPAWLVASATSRARDTA
jgi:hypothetical protein